MHHSHRLIRAVLIALLLLLTGCASLAGTSSGHIEQAEEARAKVEPWPELPESQPSTTLTELIPSTALQSLVKEAMNANPSLQQTLLTLRQRLAEERQSRGDRLPSLEAGLSGSREEDADNRYTGSVDVSWEVDLWQRLANEQGAAGKAIEQQGALYQSARDTLAAEVMTAWIDLIAQQYAIEIQSRRLATLEQNEAVIVERYRAGVGSLEDLDTARSNLASARATQEGYRETLAQQQRSLRTLLARSNDSEVTVPERFPDMLLPQPSLPDQTLARRPDLRAAYAAIEEADLNTQVAYKELLPSLSISAALEDVSTSLSQALLTDPLWSLLGQLTVPLFKGGSLKASVDIAELKAAEAYQAYRETLLDAINEVEDAIGYETSLQRQIEHTQTALSSAHRSLQQYQQRYRSGLATLLELLEVQQQTYDLEASLNNLTQERLANRINLGLALGLGVDE